MKSKPKKSFSRKQIKQKYELFKTVYENGENHLIEKIEQTQQVKSDFGVFPDVGFHTVPVSDREIIITDENEIKAKYLNPENEMVKDNKFIRVLFNETDQKLKILFFHSYKKRHAGQKFFGKPTLRIGSITVHLKTGNFYSFKSYNKNKNNSGKHVIPNRLDLIKNLSFLDGNFNKYVTQELLDLLSKYLEVDGDTIHRIILNFFLKKKNIDIKYLPYLMQDFPGTKKNKKGYIDIETNLLTKYKLPKERIKVYRKLMINSDFLMSARSLKLFDSVFGKYGVKYIHSLQNKDVLKFGDSSISGMNPNFEDVNYDFITKRECSNMLKVLNDIFDPKNYDVNTSRSFNNTMILLYDQLRMISKLRVVHPNINFTSTDYKSLRSNHTHLSKLENEMRVLYITEYVYDQKTIDILEEPIVCLDDNDVMRTYTPFILKNTNDYKNEGTLMHHCVGGYVNKEKSMIISLRSDDDVWVTAEYNISNGKIVQERAVSNQKPREDFGDPLAILWTRVDKLSKLGTLNWREKKMVENVINGVSMKDLAVKRGVFAPIVAEPIPMAELNF